MRAREIDVGPVPCLALRVTYVGELGWELYCPMEFGLRLWDTIWAAGREHGLAAGGYKAIDSCRLEKGYRVWGADITPDDNPYEAGLEFAVKLDKGDFIGRDALLAAGARAPARLPRPRIREPWRSGRSPCGIDGAAVGRVTSGGYGYTVGRSIAYAYVPAGNAGPASRSRSRSSASGSPGRSRPSRCTTRPESASARRRAVPLTARPPAGVNSTCTSSNRRLHLTSAPTSEDRGTQLDDERLLHRLGYAQELFRAMGGFQNFAISFTIISILAGCLTSYYIAFQWGGPVAVTWGWLLVGGFCIIVSLAIGEIASTYPTAGGLYYWASKLGSPAWGWFTGWFNLVGQIAVTAAIGYGLAIFATSLLNLLFDYPNTSKWVFVTYTVVMAIAVLVNMFRVSVTRRAEHDLGVVAHGRRVVDRRDPDRRPRPPSVGRLRLRRDDQQLRLLRSELRRLRCSVRVRDRTADGPVHDHGLRRVRAHGGGDAQASRMAAIGHGHVGRRLGDLRLRRCCSR